MAIDPLSGRLSDFDLGKKNPAEFDPTKWAGASIEPLISMARQKPDLSEFLSTARASGPRLQSLASRLPDLSGLRAETSGPIEESPSFKAATKAYEAGVEPGVINQMTIRGLGSGTALAGALGRTRASAMLPIIENETARRDARLRAIAGFEEAGIGRELGAAETGDKQLLNALLAEAGLDESAITRALGAGQTGLQNLLNTGLTETGRTFTAGETEKNRQVQRELGDKQLQAILALAAGQFGVASLPTVLSLLGKTGLGDMLGLSSKTSPEGGNIGSQVAQGTGSEAVKQAVKAAMMGGTDAAQITQALVGAGMTQQAASSLVQQVLAEDAGELANIGQFDPNTFAPFINPSNSIPSITEEPLGMLPSSEAGDLAGLVGFGMPPEMPGLPFESAFSGLDFAGPGASSAALENVADPVLKALGLTKFLPAGLGVFGAAAGGIGGLVSLIRSLAGPGGQPHWYDKVYEQTIPQVEDAMKQSGMVFDDETNPYRFEMYSYTKWQDSGVGNYLQPFSDLMGSATDNNVLTSSVQAALQSNLPTPEQAAKIVLLMAKGMPNVLSNLEDALSKSTALYDPQLVERERANMRLADQRQAEQDKLDRMSDDSGE